MKTIRKLWVILLLLCLGNSFAQTSNNMNWKEQRKEMLEKQIIDRGIKSKEVLEAMMEVPRHEFVPIEYRKFSYDDSPLPIGHDQTISQPYIVAYMTEQLDLDKNEKVLEVGTGSGYQAAVLALICDTVHTIEIIRPLGEKAKRTLASLGYDNVKVRIGDGYKGWPSEAPFDAIIVTCAPTDIPQPLKEQLSEGGRMIIPAGNKWTQVLYLLEKKNGRIIEKAVLPVQFVPMIDEEGDKY